ncbi:gp53-like domain-containing protein [Komagataeibacter melomenusus]
MDLIIGTGTVAEASRDTMPATGTPGWATDGNPAATIPATDFPAAHYNMVMAEIIQPILDAGLTLDPANWGQLSAAIKALAKQAASGAVVGSPGVLATGDVAGSVLYYSSALSSPAFTYGSTTVGLATTTALTSALGNYLPLGGGNVTGDMDYGDKTKASTVTHRFWSAGPPATGDATPDATVTMTGGTPGTANQGTMKWSLGTFDLTGAGNVLVPDVTDFTTQGALGARVAEGRYISSVAGTGTLRVVSIVRDVGNNLLVTYSDGTTDTFPDTATVEGIFTYGSSSTTTGEGAYWYQKLPSGLIVQGMHCNFTSIGGTHKFPIAFPNQAFQVNGNDIGSTGFVVSAAPANQSSFKLWMGAPTIEFAPTDQDVQCTITAWGY